MSFKRNLRCRTGIITLLCILFCFASVNAQKVQISFDKFHGYNGTVDYIKKIADSYPNISELLEIGKSTMGRPVYVLVITNTKTGTTIDQHVQLRNMRKENVKNVTPMKYYHGKPGHWIDGGTHGNEYTGSEVCLYIIDKLVSAYGNDSEITDLIDNNTFYICPIVNPDGVYNSVEKGISQRQNTMLQDDDEDGKVNEDGPEDLNGDGFITQFRYIDAEGRYVKDDQDPRVMVRLGRDEETDKERYSVVQEGKDNDGDGESGEDPERGIDVNRNFPEGWYNDDLVQSGSGYYPSSAPESKNILEFFTNHTNIYMVQSFHTSGGFTYRPFARWPDSKFNARDLAIYDKIMGKKYLELLGVDIPDAWKVKSDEDQPQQRTARTAARRPGGQQRAAAGRGGSARGYELPREWQHPYNDSQNRPYGYGIFIDWAYAQFGTYSMTTELWNQAKDIPGMPDLGEDATRTDRERAAVKFQDDNRNGELFVNWKSYNHPQHGQGEIGGWIPLYRGNAWPGEPLEGVCETHWQFELYKAKMLPKIEISDASAKVVYEVNNARNAEVEKKGDTFTIKKGSGKGSYKIVEVKATIQNTGQLHTHIAGGERLAGNRQDAVWLIADRDKTTFLQGTPFMQLGVLPGTLEVPGVPAQSTERQQAAPRFRMRNLPPGMPMQMVRRFMQRRENTKVVKKDGKVEVSWLIAVEGNAPLKMVVTSQKGGTIVKNLKIN